MAKEKSINIKASEYYLERFGICSIGKKLKDGKRKAKFNAGGVIGVTPTELELIPDAWKVEVNNGV